MCVCVGAGVVTKSQVHKLQLFKRKATWSGILPCIILFVEVVTQLFKGMNCRCDQFPYHFGSQSLSSKADLVCAVFSCIQTTTWLPMLVFFVFCFTQVQMLVHAILYRGWMNMKKGVFPDEPLAPPWRWACHTPDQHWVRLLSAVLPLHKPSSDLLWPSHIKSFHLTKPV